MAGDWTVREGRGRLGMIRERSLILMRIAEATLIALTLGAGSFA